MELLGPGEVHLKYAFVDEFKGSQSAAEAAKIISSDEKHRQQKYAFEKDQDHYLLARYLIRISLSSYCDKISPEEWTFDTNHYGRPAVTNDGAPKDLHFNLSHSGGMVVCGFASTYEVGVDVENVTRICSHMSLAEHSFSQLEVEKLKTFESEKIPSEFFKFWTLKESYIKARGMGLHLPLDQFSFVVDKDQSVKVLFDPRMKEDPNRWSFKLLHPRENFQVAVALASAHDLKLREDFLRFL